MRILLIFDQGLAGAGGKSNPNIEPQLAKGGIGSALMLEPHFKEINGNIIATLYCGNEYFLNHKDEVVIKMAKMAEKINPDVVVCGPSFNFLDYSKMCAMIAEKIQDISDIPVVTMMSNENEDTISNYKDKITILKMPKKGGTGLDKSFTNLTKWIDYKLSNKDLTHLEEDIKY